MIQYTNSFDICQVLAKGMQKNGSFQDFAQHYYGRNWTVEVDFDRLRQDWKKIAPFAVILPQSEKVESTGLSTYGVGVLLGVVDGTMNDDLVRHMQGLEFLSTLAVPALFSGVGKTTDSISGLNFTDFECEYDQESFPLIYCNIALTLTMSTAIGRRRI